MPCRSHLSSQACSFCLACSFRSLCPCSAMAQRSGDVHQNPDVREIHSFQESTSFGTGPSGDGPAVPRPRSSTSRERRSSAAAPLPWRHDRPSASEEDCRMVDGARRALRFLFEPEHEAQPPPVEEMPIMTLAVPVVMPRPQAALTCSLCSFP